MNKNAEIRKVMGDLERTQMFGPQAIEMQARAIVIIRVYLFTDLVRSLTIDGRC